MAKSGQEIMVSLDLSPMNMVVVVIRLHMAC
jgi:hypothetical protein